MSQRQSKPRPAGQREPLIEDLPPELAQMSTDELLSAYRETGDQELKWALVLRHAELVRMIASRVQGIYSDFAQLDDMVHEGILVLLDAVDKFDPSKGAKFSTYVSKRIRGMIVDLARQQDWSSRQVRQRAGKINRLKQELFVELGRVPTSREMAERLGISLEKYEEILSDIAVSNLMSFEMLLDSYGGEPMQSVKGVYADTGCDQPETIYQEQELRQILAKGIRELRESEQQVLSLYYEKEMRMKEIAQVLGVSAPRVSQIHSRAIQKLRTYMEQYLSDGTREKRNGSC